MGGDVPVAAQPSLAQRIHGRRDRRRHDPRGRDIPAIPRGPLIACGSVGPGLASPRPMAQKTMLDTPRGNPNRSAVTPTRAREVVSTLESDPLWYKDAIIYE